MRFLSVALFSLTFYCMNSSCLSLPGLSALVFSAHGFARLFLAHPSLCHGLWIILKHCWAHLIFFPISQESLSIAWCSVSSKTFFNIFCVDCFIVVVIVQRVVAGRRVNLVHVTPSWMEGEISSIFEYVLSIWCIPGTVQETLSIKVSNLYWGLISSTYFIGLLS